MANEAGETQINPQTQVSIGEFMDFIRNSVANEAKLKIQPINGNASSCLLVSSVPNKADTALEVNHLTAQAIFDAQDMEDLDKAEDLTPEEMDVKNTAALLAGRIMQRTNPTTS